LREGGEWEFSKKPLGLRKGTSLGGGKGYGQNKEIKKYFETYRGIYALRESRAVDGF